MRRIITARERFAKPMDAPEFAGVPGLPPEISPPSKSIQQVGVPGDPLQKGQYHLDQAKQRLNIDEFPDTVNDPNYALEKAGHGYGDMVDNLVSHYDGSSSSQKKNGRLWYRTAHSLFKNMAKEHGITHERAVAIGSALSPNTDWDVNIKLARRFLKEYRPHDNPEHDEQDWRMSHIHPAALQQFAATNGGRDPGDEDIDQLADIHKAQGHWDGALNDPDIEQSWKTNIKHRTMQNVLTDHAKQMHDNRLTENWTPSSPMRDAGLPTLGGNIKKAKMIQRSREDPSFFHAILNGPKTRNFSSNILDKTRIDRNGYYEHPNGDWTQHADLGGTIDAHHIRAASMAHGQWVSKGYREEKGVDPSSPYVYDVYNRGLLEATHRINAREADPTKHLTPKQVQAVIWIKHKQDNERFKAMGVEHEGQVTPRMHREYNRMMRDKKLKQQMQQVASLTQHDFDEMPPLWRKMFLTGDTNPEWLELLEAWVEHNSPEPPRDRPESLLTDDRSLRDPRLGAAMDAVWLADQIVSGFDGDWNR